MLEVSKIKKHADFVRTSARGSSAGESCFTLLCALNTRNSGSVRVGFTASKKSIGNAVSRNFAKRRMRASLMPLITELGLADHDYVIIAKRGIAVCKFSDLVASVRRSLNKVNSKVRA